LLAEATTTKLHRDRDSKGFEPLKKDAQEGGAVAGSTRRDIERRSGKSVVTSENFKGLTGKGRKKPELVKFWRNTDAQPAHLEDSTGVTCFLKTKITVALF